jgi:phosphonate degradation associated HDIG domain protein
MVTRALPRPDDALATTLTIDGICALFDVRGGRMYSGEPVTQLEHALQSAALAEAANADAALITAALLHDLGHLLNDQGETPTERGIDDVHQYFALPFLRPLFGDDVLEPIRLHVDAKRYLCAARPGYHDALSADSQRSLALQGGIYSPAEADAFAALPAAAYAVKLRLWDDAAKSAGRKTPLLSHFVPIMEAARRA